MDNDLMARRLRPPSEPAPSQSQSQPMLAIDSAPLQQDQFQWQPDHGTDPLAPAQTIWTPPAAPFAPPPAPLPVAHTPPEPTPAPFVPQAQPAPFVPQPQPTPAQPQVAAPFTWPTARDQEAPWDRPSDYPAPIDSVDPDQPAWDRPSPTDWIDPEEVDDRTPEMFEAYADRQMSKVATAPVAWRPAISAPEVQAPFSEQPQPAENAADPYDAYAPVLRDVSVPASRPWPETNGHDNGRNAPTVAAIAAPTRPAAPIEFSSDFAGQPEAQAHDVGPAVGATVTLSEPTAGPPPWANHEPAANVRVPIPPSGMGEGGPGPTPPADLFDNFPVVEDPLFVPEPEFPAPESQTDLPAASQPTDSDGVNQSAPTQAISQDSTAPPTPLVVRIEIAFGDGSKQVVDAAEVARRVGPLEPIEDDLLEGTDFETEKFMPRHPAFEPRGPRAQEIYDVPAPMASAYEAPTEQPSFVTPVTPVTPVSAVTPVTPVAASAPFAPAPQTGPQPVEPFVWPQSDWIEPTDEVEPTSGGHSVDEAVWPNERADASSEQATPWIHTPLAPEPQPAPWTAQDYFAPEETFPPLAPLVRPVAAPQPRPFAEPAPAWPQRTYLADPLAQLPAAAAPTPAAWPQEPALAAWPQVIQHPAAAPQPATVPQPPPAPQPTATASIAPASTAFAPSAATPFSQPAERIPEAPAAQVAAAPAPAAPAFVPPPAPRPASHEAPQSMAAAQAAPALSTGDRSDLWFLSTEPDTATVESEEAVETKEPSPLITATLTIGMAVLVIVLVFVFIQLMTSLLG